MAEDQIILGAAAVVLNAGISSDSSSSGSEEDDEVFTMIANRIEYLERVKNHRPKVVDYYERVVPQYSMDDFRSHFRLTRESVENLMIRLQASMLVMGGQVRRRPTVQPEKGLLIFLWVLSNQESFRCVADRFGVGKGHAHRIFISFCKNISALTKEMITWPTGNEMNATLQGFADLRPERGFPGVIGCVDGTHIEVPGPKGDNSFYNRNKYHSVILQGVCDAKGAFIDVYAGWPGSVHDARVWKHCPLYHKLEQDEDFLPENIHILGDSAYPLSKYMMTVYKDNGFLTPKQKHFNRMLSSKRVVIENAFGRLKQLFRRLKYLDMIRFDNLKFVILAACVCHNIATWQGQLDEGNEFDEGLAVPQIGDNDDDPPVNNNAAKAKRDAIADMLYDN